MSRGKVWEWIKSWLSRRKQRVCINDQYSMWRYVTSGVPQGSVLGHVLFLIFINDLEIDIVNSVFKFVDDTILHGKVNDNNDRDQLQQDLYWSDACNGKCHSIHLNVKLCIWDTVTSTTIITWEVRR